MDVHDGVGQIGVLEVTPRPATPQATRRPRLDQRLGQDPKPFVWIKPADEILESLPLAQALP